ncbi:hypothetical protein F2Q69_00036582 [Brassica cretica]|uniref:Uncharacterized protein n=1 Tax=Brassica cretica TaxID=69181 RepID=A0A8S9SEJ7_BRACR|nr:hypothetical protein F2Q69_00036582 [Brassica cretica]
MVDGSWTSTTLFSSCGWIWMDSLGPWGRFNLWRCRTIDDKRLLCIQKWKHCDGNGRWAMGDGEYASAFDMT